TLFCLRQREHFASAAVRVSLALAQVRACLRLHRRTIHCGGSWSSILELMCLVRTRKRSGAMLPRRLLIGNTLTAHEVLSYRPAAGAVVCGMAIVAEID